MKILKYLISSTIIIIMATVLHNCSDNYEKGTFGYDLNFLNQHKNVIVLKSQDENCQLAIIPDYQGRVMTSSSNGLHGKSYGWVNYDLISSNKLEEHINVFGGEDRFWIGPEGGQYSIFFKKGTDFTLENWFTPKPIDSEEFTLVDKSESHVSFKKQMKLVNYQGNQFKIDVEREINLLSSNQITQELGISLDSLAYVAFQSENTIRNIGTEKWTKDKGLLSIWILGMFVPSEETVVILPYKDSLELNTAYFGEIAEDRFKVHEKAVLFKGDGMYRCKIGLPPQNVTPYFGSYNPKDNVLTIIKYSFENDSCYVNSLWDHQEKPFNGDVINSYNDGPLDSGEILGPFYELESSSAAKELHANEALTHKHTTYHFEGDFTKLDEISQLLLGISLNEFAFNE